MSQHTKDVRADDAEVGDSLVDDLEKELGAQLGELEELVREHPLATVGIAAALGVAVALILTRR